jgi:hypothetical protein
MTTFMQDEPRMGVLTLSRGADSPYVVRADLSRTYPDDATCAVLFWDTTGDLANTIPGTNMGSQLQFTFPQATADTIPAGYLFETFIYYSDGTKEKLRYGQVIRREATFLYPPATQQSAQSLQYSDSFANRTGQPGNLYAQVYGNVTIADNSLADPPKNNALSLNIGLLFVQAGVRIARSSNGDSVRFAVTMVTGGAGVTVIGIAANTNLTSYACLILNANTNTAALGVGSGPVAYTAETSTVADTVADEDVYVIDYNLQSNTYKVFKNGSTTAMLTWVDSTNKVVHGQGYRYPMFAFDASLLSPGPEVTEWEFQDYVGS